MEPKEDKIGYYYTKSDISLMKIRVTVNEFSTTQILKKSFAEIRKTSLEGNSGIRLQQFSEQEQNGNNAFQEDVIIMWQEKILSPCEKREYERPKYRRNEKFSEYHKLALRNKGKTPTRIFTYVDKDDYRTQELPATTSKREISPDTLLRNRFRQLSVQESTSEDEGKILWFYVMADLTPEESYGDTSDNDVVLCKMKYDIRGELLVDPDFSKHGSKPYRIVGVGKGNAIYEYTIQIVMEKTIEEKIESETIPQMIKTESTSEFDRVSGTDIRIVFVGEITRAVNFTDSSSPLYLQYELHLPPGWKCEGDSSPLNGMSESCLPIYDQNGVPVCNFSLPLNFSLRRSPKDSSWPCLLFAIFSREWLTNDKDSGFGVLQLPQPGGQCVGSEIEIKTWRPLPTTPSAKLRRYFLGGVQLISDPSFFIPSQKERPVMSRLGFKTESSGSVWVRLHSILQINNDLEGFRKEEELEKLYYHPSTLAVIRAFHKSYVRLKAAKQSL